MSFAKRLLFLLIALMIVAFAATLLTGGDESNDGRIKTQATAVEVTTQPTATTKPTPAPPPLLKAGAEPTLTYTKGDVVRFRVVHPTAEEVHVHGYDFTFDLEPGVTRTISFPARIEGQFEIELERSATPLAKLVVEPR